MQHMNTIDDGERNYKIQARKEVPGWIADFDWIFPQMLIDVLPGNCSIYDWPGPRAVVLEGGQAVLTEEGPNRQRLILKLRQEFPRNDLLTCVQRVFNDARLDPVDRYWFDARQPQNNCRFLGTERLPDGLAVDADLVYFADLNEPWDLLLAVDPWNNYSGWEHRKNPPPKIPVYGFAINPDCIKAVRKSEVPKYAVLNS